ncbi:MAG: hypothetical protein ACRDPT_10015 [Streptomycetales bacterium]
MTELALCVRGATVVDPAARRLARTELCVAEGRLVADPVSGAVLDATGLFVLAGLVDMHVSTSSRPRFRPASGWHRPARRWRTRCPAHLRPRRGR